RQGLRYPFRHARRAAAHLAPAARAIGNGIRSQVVPVSAQSAQTGKPGNRSTSMQTTPFPPCVTATLLARNARQWPDLVVLKFDSGERYTTVELLDAVRRHAAGLQALGVQQGDHVLCWMPNGPPAVLAWLALNLLGAVYVPINTAYKGRLLQHVIDSSGASLMLASAQLLERL